MLRRGFKSWCENTSLAYRNNLGLEKDSPLCPFALAKHLKIQLINPTEVTDLKNDDLKTLLTDDSGSWSAVAISSNNMHLIIYNSSHAKTRQANDIMHELSHIIIGHKPQSIHHSPETGLLLRDYDKNQEEEADCFAAILLLPRDAVFKIKFSKLSETIAARNYGVSPKLLQMRLNTSGANHVYRHTRKK